jgi:hypothetical protein
MSRLGCQLAECMGTFWCPRCGTLKVDGQNGTVAVPALVERCRKFDNLLILGPLDAILADWTRFGIAEAINTPANRSTPDAG